MAEPSRTPPLPAPPEPPSTPAARAVLVLILVAFALLSAHASWLTPIFEVPDEKEHLEVVHHWATEGTMPDLTQMRARQMVEGVQPPLAYWFLAAGMHVLDLDDVQFLGRRRRPADVKPARPYGFRHGADETLPYAGPVLRFHLLRLLNVLAGLATIVFTWRLARLLAPRSEAMALGAAAIVAANPSFAFLCGGITNGPLAIALGTASLVGLLRLLLDPAPTDGRVFRLGLLFGVSLLAKLSAVFLFPTTAVALTVAAWSRRKKPGAPGVVGLVRQGYFLAIGTLLPAGPWLTWNVLRYGDPLAWELGQAKFGGTSPVGRIDVLDALARRYLPQMLESYWPAFGSNLFAGFPIAASAAVLFGGGAIGLAIAAWRRRPGLGVRWPLVAVLLLATAVNLAAGVKFYLDFAQPHGRYLFPSIGAVATLIALGWSGRAPRFVPAVGVVVLFVLGGWAQWHVLGPAFQPPDRAGDPYFAAVDLLQGVPETVFREDLVVTTPTATVNASIDPPRLRWVPRDVSTRYTVLATAPGLGQSIDEFETRGLGLHDRWTMLASLWDDLPPRVPVTLSIIELPRLDTVSALHAGEATLSRSPPLVFTRVPGEPARPRDGESSAGDRDSLATVRLWIRVGAQRLRAEDGGPRHEPRLPVLFLPDNGGSMEHWSGAAAHVRRDRRALAFDLRGSGSSNLNPDGDYRLDAHVDDAFAVMDTLGVDHAVVVGHGFGAAVALAMATRRPARVAGLFLLDVPRDLAALRLKERDSLRRALSGRTFEDTLRARTDDLLRHARPDVAARLLAESALVRRNPYADSELSLFDFDPLAALADVRAQDLPVSALRTSPAETLPGLSSRVLDGVSHWAMLDDPDAVHGALDAWLREVDARR